MKQQSRNKLIVTCVAALGLVFFVWWGSFDSIGDILKGPASYREKTVRLFGRVGSVHNEPFAGGLYRFSDTSGGMWVITKNDSTTEGKIMYVEAALHTRSDKETLEVTKKLRKILDRAIFEGSQIPPMLVERDRGGIFASLKAVRAKK